MLMKECGAEEGDRTNFIYLQSQSEIKEWRFRGNLGDGGKFWRNDGRLYVSCYREDLTDERAETIERVNKLLEPYTRRENQ